jgi:outer membrane receptor protein involved in Fe transport
MTKWLVFGLLLSVAASAQETPVTGSLVPGAPSIVPVRIIDRAQLEASGYATFGEFLQRLPEQGAAQNENVNNGGDGSAQMALHNLDAQRTLVLVDGKRWAPYGTGGITDLNTIPTHAIERIEILESGGASLYGSGAIGGVVNIVTRKRASETEAQAYGGMSTRGDSRQYDVHITSGVSGDKSSFFFGVGYLDRRALPGAQRGWASQVLAYDFNTGTVSRGGSPVLPNGTVNLLGCVSQLCTDLRGAFPGAQTVVAAGDCPGCVNGFRPLTSSDLYNFAQAQDLVTPTQQFSLFSNAEVRFSPVARAYFQGSFVNRRWSNLLASDPLGAVEPINVDAGSVYNPFGTSIQVMRRVVEAPQRSEAWDLDTYRVVLGIDGGLPTGLTFDLSFNFGQTVGTDQTDGSFLTTGIQQSVGPSFADASGVHCTSGAAGCVPANLLGPPGSLTPEMLASMGLHHGINHSLAQVANARLDVTQTLFQLGPAREATLAAGYEYRAEYAAFTPDALAAQDDTYVSFTTIGGFHSNELYAELDVPVLPELDLRAATRGVDDSLYGTAATVFVGGRLELENLKGLSLRGSFSTGLRSPSVFERFNTTPISIPVTNTVGIPVGVQIVPLGNPHLQPERSRNGTVGLLIEPPPVRGLLVSADYWNIAVTHSIASGLQSPFNNATSGSIDTSGVDLAVRYALGSPAGRFGLRGTLRYLINYNFGDGSNVAGNYDLGASGFFNTQSTSLGGLTPRLKGDAAIDWQLAGFTAQAAGRFIGGFDEGSPPRSVSPYFALDLSASWTIDKTTLAAGVHNLIDANPPPIYTSFLTFADPAYDFIGRFVYARASQRF